MDPWASRRKQRMALMPMPRPHMAVNDWDVVILGNVIQKRTNGPRLGVHELFQIPIEVGDFLVFDLQFVIQPMRKLIGLCGPKLAH
jgi:hypothetical protein